MITHRALVRCSPTTFAIMRRPTSDPRGGELLVAPRMVGICGTDVQIARNLRPDSATVLGHEGVVEVVRGRPVAPELAVGQLAIVNPVSPDNQDRIVGHSIDGLLQERLLLTEQEALPTRLVPFGNTIPEVCGPLVEPLAAVIYGDELVRRLVVPESVAIIGSGPLALLTALLARLRGTAQIMVLLNSERRAAWATARGILKHHECIVNARSPAAWLLDRTHGRGVDVLYICTPRPASVQMLSETIGGVADNGVISLAGGISDGDSIPELPGLDLNSARRANVCGTSHNGGALRCTTQFGKGVWVTGHRGTSLSHLRRSMDLLEVNYRHFGRIISHVMSLPHACSYFRQLANSNSRTIDGDECVKVIVDITMAGERVEPFDIGALG